MPWSENIIVGGNNTECTVVYSVVYRCTVQRRAGSDGLLIAGTGDSLAWPDDGAPLYRGHHSSTPLCHWSHTLSAVNCFIFSSQLLSSGPTLLRLTQSNNFQYLNIEIIFTSWDEWSAAECWTVEQESFITWNQDCQRGLSLPHQEDGSWLG